MIYVKIAGALVLATATIVLFARGRPAGGAALLASTVVYIAVTA